MLEEIEALYNEGFSLLPLDGKKAAIKWEALQTKRLSLSEIKAYFGQGDKNLGIVTGKISGIVVLDIDPRNGGVVSEWLSKYPTSRFVITGTGGAHLYYKHPGGKVENLHPAKGVDIKGDGGYVVAPPSLHPDSGKPYVWVGNGPMADFPMEVLNEIHVNKEEASDSWISSLILNGAPDGEKNNSIASLAGYLASKEIPLDVTKAFMSKWNKGHVKPHDPEQLDITVTSVYKTKNRRTKTPEVEVRGDETQIGPKSFRLQGFSDYMHEYGDAPVQWLIPGWMPEKTILFTISPPGTGKTWILFDLAVSVATGGKFLGKVPVRRSGPVILIQQEDDHGQSAQRIEVIRQAKMMKEVVTVTGDDVSLDLPKTMPLYIHTDRKLKFEDKKSMEGLAKQIEILKPVLVILDPLYSAASTDDYMTKATEQMFFLKELRDKYGCSFVIAHHTNKGGAEDRTRAWGSTFLNAFLETGWQLYKKGESKGGRTSMKVKVHFKAGQPPPDRNLSFYIDTEKEFRYEVIEGLVDDESGTEDEISEMELIKPDADDLATLASEPSDSEMEAANSVVATRGPRKITNDVIFSYLAKKGDWVAARNIANDLGFNLPDTARKLDKMVDSKMLLCKDNPRLKPGFKKWYKVKF